MGHGLFRSILGNASTGVKVWAGMLYSCPNACGIIFSFLQEHPRVKVAALQNMAPLFQDVCLENQCPLFMYLGLRAREHGMKRRRKEGGQCHTIGCPLVNLAFEVVII